MIPRFGLGFPLEMASGGVVLVMICAVFVEETIAKPKAAFAAPANAVKG